MESKTEEIYVQCSVCENWRMVDVTEQVSRIRKDAIAEVERMIKDRHEQDKKYGTRNKLLEMFYLGVIRELEEMKKA